jgi:hypothetical protein
MPLNKEMDEKLVSIRKKQAEETVDAPVEVHKAEPESTDEPIKPEAVEVPKAQPAKEEPTNATNEKEVAKVDKPWYADEDEVIEKLKVDYDFSELGRALELGEVKTKDEFITKASEFKSKLKQLEEDQLSGVPDDFKEVIKATKSGANWKDYLASQLIDYTKIDPLRLYEDEFYREAEKNQR